MDGTAVTVLPRLGRKTHVAELPVEGARTLCGALIRAGWVGGGAVVDCVACAHSLAIRPMAVRPGDWSLVEAPG